MKQFFSIVAVLFSLTVFSQAPQLIRYQGVARDAAGLPIANGTIDVQFEIHNTSAAGPVIFTEFHSNVSTNQFGIFNLSIGSVTPLPASVFGNGDEFLEVSIDFGTGLTSMGTSQLLSVPYALYADSCGTSGPAGQSITEVYGTGQLSVGAATTTPTLVPGLTTTVNVPASSVVHVHTDGGIQSTGATSSTYSVVDIGLYVDGVLTTPAGQRRIAIANTSSLAQLIGNWSIDHTYTLTPGNHTFEVRASGGVAGSSSANVSSGSANLLRGVLSVEIIRQ